jgi:hypothetical protein
VSHLAKLPRIGLAKPFKQAKGQGVTMKDVAAWQEVESTVHCPGRWLALLVGGVFLLAGGMGFVVIGGAVPPGFPFWFSKVFWAIFALLGGVIVAWIIGTTILPAHILHASLDVLPDVPREPVIREGAIVYGRLTHELNEEDQGWQLRPSERLRRNDMGLLFGFGIPFLVLFSGLLAWVFQSQLKIGGWAVSAVCGIALTAISGGTAVLLIGLMMRAGYRRLSWLTIPRDGSDLELDSPEEPNPEKADWAEGLKWVFLGETKRHRLSIPRELVVAVQLCPWKYVVAGSGGRQITWAVQGLLVLTSPKEGVCHRLPLLLTSDFVRASRLMQRLADTLHVPYLFCADAEGWKAEAIRAKNRPPLRIGGSQS